jgi:carbamoyltransferase
MTVKRNYVGLACTFHDSAIAIVNSAGDVVFAEATERWLQNKRAVHASPDLPVRTRKLIAEYCDADAETVLAFTWTGQHADFLSQILPFLQKRFDGTYSKSVSVDAPDALLRRRFYGTDLHLALSEAKASTFLGSNFDYEHGRQWGWQHKTPEKRFFDHHSTHAAAGCFSSGFPEAACAIVDGQGERSASTCFTYRDGRIAELPASLPEGADAFASLGAFYGDVCEACGFDMLAGEEWKVMGLAAYGTFDSALYPLLKAMIAVDGLTLTAPHPDRAEQLKIELFRMSPPPGRPAIAMANLARTAQVVFEETLFGLLRNLHAETGSDNLVLGGGCALNSSANGRILAETPFKRVYIFAAPADDGNAVGAALLAYQQDNAGYLPPKLGLSPYLGSPISAAAKARLHEFGPRAKMTHCGSDAPERAAQLLADGQILGWIQGRAEFGPRALGNRSILADPRKSSVKDRLNSLVKFREEFRPFAPSVLHEHGPNFFEDYQESRYMERTLKFRPEVRGLVPGAVHVDGTGRLQTVKKEWNPPYHALLTHFHSLTGVPLVINTSFNVMGRPLIHDIEDALSVFYMSGLDGLFVGDILIQK